MGSCHLHHRPIPLPTSTPTSLPTTPTTPADDYQQFCQYTVDYRIEGKSLVTVLLTGCCGRFTWFDCSAVRLARTVC